MPSIKMRTTSAGPAGTRLAGQVYSVSLEEGEALVQGNYASWVEAPVSEAPAIERAVAPPAENAVAPAGQPTDSRRPRRRR